MLKTIPLAKGRPAAIPPSVTTLSVSWLNGQFRAIAIHRGAVEGTWERPGEVEGSANFDSLLREAVEKTGYKGQTVSLLLGHPRLTQQMNEVPPVRGPALTRLVQRQAQQQKMFDGEAAWASQAALSGRGSQRVILHLFPKLLLNQLIQGAVRNDLDLISVVPVSAAVHGQLTRIPLDKDEVALLAAETGGSTTVFVGRGDGQVLLARTLSGNWNENLARLAVDVNRTVLFVNQQFGVAASTIWLYGQGASEQVGAMQAQLPLPVKLSPAEIQPFYWATEAVKLPVALTPNFISREQQQAPQRRLLLKMAAAIVVLLVLSSLLVSAYLLLKARDERVSVSELESKAAELQTRHTELQKVQTEIARKADVVKMVIDGRPPPVPGWFLGYLSEVVPPDLVVTNLHVKRQEDLWEVQLAGTVPTAARQTTPAAFSNSVSLLRSRLENGPFHMRLWDPNASANEGQAAARAAAGGSFAGWVAKLVATPPKPKIENQFEIEGAMR